MYVKFVNGNDKTAPLCSVHNDDGGTGFVSNDVDAVDCRMNIQRRKWLCPTSRLTAVIGPIVYQGLGINQSQLKLELVLLAAAC